ncbi:type II toxin-antitoxin system Phd/YefM family antitoxin [Polaromonas sp. JS666]|uniref:type II toxin-antitoxin system Phd/YefM family antitoxin n=1 Tax=Polaromonas sp. (strain JS666 / ATCC BAA-500) TaxID=296591 RepID=UPI00005333CF|nr:type II toxin-antitoxin system Phd/YefM family antitoxin [Polaromonas sp. JS666]ABE47175.1 Prevent-host-death protein [Polaromonas sp. JS666]
MEQFSSTDAKQRFGQLLKASASAPVAIEKHGRVAAYLTSPEFFERVQKNDPGNSARQLARVKQAVIEKDRLIRHQRIAFDLVTLAPDKRDWLIKDARAMVDRWRAERLCSADYIQKWEQILKMNPQEMAATIVSDVGGWGASLRQNSPWVGVHA